MDQPELMNTMDELDTFMLPQHQRHKTWLVMAREQAPARTAGEPSEEDIRKELTRRAKQLAKEFVVSLLLLWLLLDLNEHCLGCQMCVRCMVSCTNGWMLFPM